MFNAHVQHYDSSGCMYIVQHSVRLTIACGVFGSSKLHIVDSHLISAGFSFFCLREQQKQHRKHQHQMGNERQ